MAKPTGLQKRNNVWFIRVVIPRSLRPFLENKTEIVRSLKATNYAEACIRVREERVRIDKEFALARRKATAIADGMATSSIFPVIKPISLDGLHAVELSDVELKQIVDTHLHNWLSKSRKDFRQSGPNEERSDQAEEDAGLIDDALVQRTAKSILYDAGVSLDPTGASWEALNDLVERALREEALRRRDWYAGQPSDKAHDIAFASVSSASGSQLPKPVSVSKFTLSMLIDKYISDPGRRDISNKTQMAYKVLFRLLKELLGSETPVRSITRAQCKEVQEIVSFLPSNYTKRWPGKKVREVVEIARHNGIKPMSRTTSNSYLTMLQSLFKYALAEEYIDKSPAIELRLPNDKVPDKDKRYPFEVNHLVMIFSAPLYCGCINDERGYAKPGNSRPKRGRFWFPLLSLWGGLRMGEACQLEADDVVVRDGVHVILVRLDDGGIKKVKTSAGIRSVPIHPELVKIGFLKHVEVVRAAGGGRLFPELMAAKTGYYSDNLSKWFANFLSKVGINDKKLVGHSFRHSFRDAMRNAKVPTEIVRAIGGWREGSTDAVYGAGPSERVLHDELIKISYPGLDLSHLYIC